MNISKYIKAQITKGDDGQFWSYQDFSHLPLANVAKSFSRLTKQGVLTRVHKGIYYKPKKTILGITSADPLQVATIALNKKKKAQVYAGGSSVFYNARLTTQVPATAAATIVSSAPRRNLKVGKNNIRVIHRNLSHMKNASQIDVALIQSLRDIKKVPDASAQAIVIKVQQMLSIDQDRLNRIISYVQQEPPRVKALVGAIAQVLKHDNPQLDKLKSSLNPLTKYKLGIAQILPTASNWNIV